MLAMKEVFAVDETTFGQFVVVDVHPQIGELVFETTDQNIGWDGTFRDKLLKPDTYDYYLEATCVQGEQKIIKGNVTLIR